jgi:hypothetical protein
VACSGLFVQGVVTEAKVGSIVGSGKKSKLIRGYHEIK